MREADQPLMPPTPQLSEARRARPSAAPHQPDGHAFPGLVVPPGLRPGMPHNTMTTRETEYVDEPLRVLAGALPPDLQGHVFVAGPSVHAGSPALASDGLVLRLDFHGDGARFTNALMRAPSHYARESVDVGATARGPVTRYLNHFRETTLADVSLTLGVQESPNTAPFLVEGEKMLLVTTDAGRPWAIHPKTLKAYTPLGYRREWNVAIPAPWAFPLLQSTAHPAFDPEPAQPMAPDQPSQQRPRLFFTNHAPKWPLGDGWTQLVSWDTWENRLHHWKLMDAATGKPVVTASLHQIAATRDYVVLLDSNFPINFWQIASQAVAPWLPGSKRLVEWLTSAPSYPQAVFWVVKRSDLRPSPGTLSAEDPPMIPAYRFQSGGGGLHFAALYENPDDVITLVAGHSPTEDLSHSLEEGELLINGNRVQDWQVGMPTAVPITRSSLGVHKIDMKRLRIQSNLYSHDDFTWGLTVFSNAGLINGELETHLRMNQTPVNEAIPPEELALYFNSDGFTADMVPEALYQLYKPIVGSRDGLPIRDGRAASFFKFFLHSGRFDGYVLPTGWFERALPSGVALEGLHGGAGGVGPDAGPAAGLHGRRGVDLRLAGHREGPHLPTGQQELRHRHDAAHHIPSRGAAGAVGRTGAERRTLLRGRGAGLRRRRNREELPRVAAGAVPPRTEGAVRAVEAGREVGAQLPEAAQGVRGGRIPALPEAGTLSLAHGTVASTPGPIE